MRRLPSLAGALAGPFAGGRARPQSEAVFTELPSLEVFEGDWDVAWQQEQITIYDYPTIVVPEVIWGAEQITILAG